jgi:hypothetical protein
MLALQKFDASEANLAKLERLWKEIAGLWPSGIELGDNPEYEERCVTFRYIYEALPQLQKWKPQVDFISWNDISEWKIDAHEIGEIGAHVGLQQAFDAPGKALREYRRRFNQMRRKLVREALAEHVRSVDASIVAVRSKLSGNEALADKMSGTEWEQLRQYLDEVAVLVGSSTKRPPRWGDLRRHLGFGMVQDFNDIENSDWPAIRSELKKGIYEEDEPIPVDVDDLAAVIAEKPRGTVTTRLEWTQLSDEEFERLMFRLISETPGYENPEWLMKTNAADKGRDLSVTRVVQDRLSGTSRERVVIQCKHWTTKSIGIPDISTIKDQMELWRDPAVDELIFATSGRFTADAVQYIEHYNGQRHAMKIGMWPESHLERLLSARPDLVAEFSLR